MISKESVIRDLKMIRKQSPLVHNITNYVVMNNTANALLSLGASPVMAHAVNEIEDIVNISSSLVINIGTLSEGWVEAMIIAGKTAHKRNIPVVFDPVGAGASGYRTETSLRIISECKPSVIRGNASEITALANKPGKTKGVDSSVSSDVVVQTAGEIAEATGAIVVVSGPVDYVTDNKSIIKIKNGSPLMPKVTGLGCSATALVAAFAAVNRNYLIASAHAMTIMGIAGEMSAKISNGPGSLQMHFLDILHNLSEKEINAYFNVES